MNTIPNSEICYVQSEPMDLSITPVIVKQKLAKLKENRACGPNLIHTKILIELQAELVLPLVYIFNRSLQDGRLPQVWKQAIVCPIFKKGDRADPAKYRPVSLMSCICKILESICYAIYDHLQVNNILCNEHLGFRSGRSCNLQLLETLQEWSCMVDKGEGCDILYLDYSKAFNTVPHERLPVKLMAVGITGKILNWIGNLLHCRQQRVVVEGVCFSWIHVCSGVPQGSVLDPVLFVIYINDLPKCVSFRIRMYADDTRCFSRINCLADVDAFQQNIDKLMSWSCDWQLCFYTSKYNVMHIGRKNIARTYK